MTTERDYPTEAELQQLREWPLDDPRGWLEFAQSIWWMADWGWPELEGDVSTGGWSGNEEIIDAMQDAHMGLLWHQVWQNTRRGGHYTFKFDAGGVSQPERAQVNGEPVSRSNLRAEEPHR